MASYRRYRANYPFDARDTSELSMKIGDTLLVSPTPQGEWPNHEKWMRGQNETTACEGDFPGGAYVQFVEEFTIDPEPEPEPELPPLPTRGGGVQVLPNSMTEDAPPTPPKRGNSATRIPENQDSETRAPKAPPRPTPRKRSSSAHQKSPLVESLESSFNAQLQQTTVDEGQHEWVKVSFQIPLRCAACKFCLSSFVSVLYSCISCTLWYKVQ